MKRLIVVAMHRRLCRDWRRLLGLTTREALYFSLHRHPDRFRGLSENKVAIVFLDDTKVLMRDGEVAGLRIEQELPEYHRRLLAIYATTGAHIFAHTQHNEITKWLRS